MKRFVMMLQADLKNISRDAMSFMILLVPPLLFLVMKFLIPLFQILVVEWFDLSHYYSLIFSVFIIMVPYMTGILAGFLLLDERDQHILEVIAITPLQRSGHLWFRSGSMMFLSVAFAIGLYPWSSLVTPNWLRLIFVVLVATLEVPLFALFLLSIAQNKVEGLAISKFMGLFSFAPILAYFLPGIWKYTMAWSPPFWLVQAYLAESQPAFWIFLVVGLLYHSLLLWVLIGHMERKSE